MAARDGSGTPGKSRQLSTTSWRNKAMPCPSSNRRHVNRRSFRSLTVTAPNSANGPCDLVACGGMPPRTIYQVLEETAAQYGDAPALRQPIVGTDGPREYLTYSWNQYKTAAQEIAAGLRSIGIRKGDVVALDSETRLEFYLADQGILASGSIA